MSDQVPEHAWKIESPQEILVRIMEKSPMTVMAHGGHILVAVDIDRNQIRHALSVALVGEAEMPREALARVREVLEKIGGPL